MIKKVITVSVCLPVSCTIEVAEDKDGDLSIVSVRRVDCSASPRGVAEAMGDDDFDAMRASFNKAKAQ